MNKKIILIFSFITSFHLNANDAIQIDESIEFDKHSVYVELFGNTHSISVNYEYIFSNAFLSSDNNITNLSFRLGLAGKSEISLANGGAVSMLYFQLGDENRLEIGTGLLFALGNPGQSWKDTNLEGTKSQLFVTLTWGYKHIWYSSGWFIKSGFSPIISFDGKFGFIFGNSVGLSF